MNPKQKKFHSRLQCCNCLSYNHIYYNKKDLAWECWNCQKNFWIDESSRLAFMFDNNISQEESELCLTSGSPNFGESFSSVSDFFRQ